MHATAIIIHLFQKHIWGWLPRLLAWRERQWLLTWRRRKNLAVARKFQAVTNTFPSLPSGKLTYGKSPSLICESTINGPFSIAMLKYQRVNQAFGTPKSNGSSSIHPFRPNHRQRSRWYKAIQGSELRGPHGDHWIYNRPQSRQPLSTVCCMVEQPGNATTNNGLIWGGWSA